MIQNKNYLDFNFFQFSDSCETKKRAIENNIETENNHLNKRICNIVKTQIVPQVHADGLDLSLDAELNRELFNLSDEESDEAIYKEEDELEKVRLLLEPENLWNDEDFCEQPLKLQQLQNLTSIKVVVESDTPNSFFQHVSEDIFKISSTETGKRLLDKIERAKKSVYIVHAYKDMDRFEGYEKLQCSVVHFSAQEEAVTGFNGKGISSPSYISLAHELIHVYRSHVGKSMLTHKSCNDFIWSNLDEYLTIVGKPNVVSRNKERICENSIRKEHGLHLRFSHCEPKCFEEVNAKVDFFIEVQKFLKERSDYKIN